MQLAALQIPAKGFLILLLHYARPYPVDWAKKWKILLACSSVEIPSMLQPAFLLRSWGHLIHFTSDPQLLRTDFLLCLRICLQ